MMAFSSTNTHITGWPRWAQELNTRRHSELPKSPSFRSIPDPPGFTTKNKPAGKDKSQTQAIARKPPTKEERDVLKLKKAWEISISPLSQLPMKAIGMWMTGNTLQIFSIYMVFTLFKEPISAIMSTNATFSKLETERTRDKMLWVKLAYIACHLLSLALGIYKVNKMGLLPTTRSDWLAWETSRVTAERAVPISPWDWAAQS